MFGLRKESLILSGVLRGITDYHSHILPGVDDGITTMDKAIQALDYYESIGISHAVLTPHIMEDYPDNTADYLMRKFTNLQNVYQGNVTLSLGAEYMIDAAFETHLNSGELLTIAGNRVLVETSCIYKQVYFEENLKMIQSKGYHIVLAHPERYEFMKAQDYKQLKEMHIRFQLNLLSLAGVYGPKAKQKAKMLLNSSLYDCLGTDMHHLKHYINVVDQVCLSAKEIKAIDNMSLDK